MLNLVELDLSANKLKTIPTSSFVSIPNLNILIMKDNPLNIVPKSAFLGLANLMKIDLSNCGIYTLLPGAFSGLNKLERLYLSSNVLSGVDDVEDVLPVIHELTLHDNPWNCDCQAKTFRISASDQQLKKFVLGVIFWIFLGAELGSSKAIISLFYNFPYPAHSDNVVNAFPVGG